MPFSKILRVLYDRATRILESKKKQRTTTDQTQLPLWNNNATYM